MDPHPLAFLPDSFRAYFCAEALLVQEYTPQQDRTGERHEEALRFLHDLLPATGVRTAPDLLSQFQHGREQQHPSGDCARASRAGR